jgi:hypothetical protein
VTGYDRLPPGTARVEYVWSNWCLPRQRWHNASSTWHRGTVGGKRVRPRTAIVPASLAAVLVFTAGLHGIRTQPLGYYSADSGLGEENWGTTAPGLLWPLWGVALGAAVLAYHLRRRGPCSRCGRGPTRKGRTR